MGLSAPVETLPHSVFWRAAPFIFLALWSSGYSFVKLGLPYTEPMTFLALRYAIVILILLVVFAWVRPPLPKGRQQWQRLIVSGLLIQSAYFGLLYIAIKLGASAGAIGLMMSLQPILVAIAAPMLLKEKVGKVRWIGLAAGISGTAVVILAKSEIETMSLLALCFAIGSLGGITAGTLYEKRFGDQIHLITANLVQCMVGFLSIFPLAVGLENLHIEWTPNLLISLGYLVIANSIISVTLLLGMIRRGEASKVSSLFFLIAPIAAMTAWLMLGEEMPLLAWFGLALAASGVLIVQRA
jgi:drug/metabolite transporter (DMT)-like permease